MGWRSILVSNPAKLSLKQEQLLYTPKDDEALSVPLEDIASIIIESHEVVITSALLGAIANYKIVLFSCDNYHMPNGAFIPFHQHSRHAQMVWLQNSWSEAFKKRVWQKIIRQKITHQARVLASFDKDKTWLLSMVSRVSSGDGENLEAQAARAYWSELFKDFRRNSKSKDGVNVALNYGYAILRGLIARAISAHGLLPVFGLHHANQLNAFNLADDLIEPFRPLVDREVACMLEIGLIQEEGICRDAKIELISLSHKNVLLKGEEVTVLTACDEIVVSLIRCSEEKEAKGFELWEWL